MARGQRERTRAEFLLPLVVVSSSEEEQLH